MKESMPVKRNIVTLTEEERETLHEIINKDKYSAQKRRRAQVLLLAEDRSYTYDMIAKRTCMSHSGVARLWQSFVKKGFDVTLEGKPGRGRYKKLSDADVALLIALVSSPKPKGTAHWSLRLLRDAWSTLSHTDKKTMSHETIRRILKKMNLSLG